MQRTLSDFVGQSFGPLLADRLGRLLVASLFTCLMIFQSVAANATVIDFDDITVSGQVLDENSKSMPGVNIVVKGTTNGTTTDGDGNYTLSVPDNNATLVFSFIGYETAEILVGNQTVINVSMKPDVNTLNEIVVVGYGVQKKSSVTGAVSSVSSKEISALPVPSVAAALQGRVPGVFVTNNGGPGTNAIVRIRGIGSITSNADPLYVVDGFPAPNFNLNSVDTKDIESVEVLKDAAATAIYGSRAANGVVLITTKTGSKDHAVHVDVEAYAGTQSAWKQLDLLNTTQYLEYAETLTASTNGTLPSRILNDLDDPINSTTDQTFRETNTDWQDEMFRPAAISQFQASLAASTDKSKIYLSFGRFKQDGIMIGTSFDRYNGRLGIETQVSKRITVGTNNQITQSNNYNQLESGGRTMIMHMIRSVPYIHPYNPDYLGGFNGTSSIDGSDPENPVRLALMDKRINNNVYILSNSFIQASIIDGLKYKFTFGINYSVNRQINNDPIYSAGSYFARNTHDLTDNRNTYTSLYYSNQLTYDKSFGSHNLNAIVVAERQDEKTNFLNTFGRTTTNAVDQLTGASGLTVDGGLSETYLLSYLGRVNYEYNGKYLLSASFRRDGFSGFAPGNKWGNFPGASVGWKLNEESFMSGISKITDLKLRASYGKVGARATQAYGYVAPVFSTTQYPIGSAEALAQGTYFQKLPNYEFTWEISTMKNIGIDLGMFNNQFTFSAEYFIKDTEDLILGTPPATSLGVEQNTDLNVGKMKNWGWEFTAGYSKVSDDFTLNISGNVGLIKNEVEALYNEAAAYYNGASQDYGAGNITRTIAGSSIQHFYIYEALGIFQNVGEIIGGDGMPTQAGLTLPLNDDGTVDMDAYNDPANIGKYTAPGDMRFGGLIDAGSFLPKMSYGLNVAATYKGFDFTMFIQGTQGNKVYNGTRVITEGMIRLFNSGTEVLNAWTPTNTNTDIPRTIALDPNWNNRPSTRYLEDGSYMRIKNLSIGYTLPPSILGFADGAIKKFRVYFSAQNLLTVTKYSGYDPEVGSRNNGSLTNGIDYGQFPQPRTFLGGVQIGF